MGIDRINYNPNAEKIGLTIRHEKALQAQTNIKFTKNNGYGASPPPKYNIEYAAGFGVAVENFQHVTPQMIKESFKPQLNLNPDDIDENYGARGQPETEDVLVT